MRVISFISCCVFLLVLRPSLRPNQELEGRRVLQVGPGRPLSVPSQASVQAKDGDIIEIDAATYTGDVAVWRANNLVLVGVGGRPHVKAGGASAQGKAIWLIQGNNTTIDNIEFSGARVVDRNGAAIRHEGLRLTVRNCVVHDNEMGILTANQPANEVLIEGSEFFGSSGEYNHNIYIGTVRKFTLQFSYIHHAIHGHNVKTRAQTNYILYNRIMDEHSGRSSYAIDIPNGGRSFVIGNLIHKGRNSENPNVIAYAAEGATNSVQELYLVNNTIVSEFARGFFFSVSGKATVSAINNLFVGQGVSLSNLISMRHNLVSATPLFRNATKFDYRLKRGSPAIDAGVVPEHAGDFDLSPRFHYVHPASYEIRNIKGPIDIGAYEFDGETLQ